MAVGIDDLDHDLSDVCKSVENKSTAIALLLAGALLAREVFEAQRHGRRRTTHAQQE